MEGQKPVVRWTAGPPRSRFDDAILRRSVIDFRKFYGDVFDCFLCLNGRDALGLDDLGAEVIIQKPTIGTLEPKGVAWKLYPPRLRPESHEIFIDHDVVLVERIDAIEEFLASEDAFLYSGSSPASRNYGRFGSLVDDGFHLNSGLFGLPPGFRFDFGLVGEWRDYFDEQGFVAASLCHRPNLIKVGIEDLWICDGDEIPKAKGYHFVHDRREEMWKRFIRMTTI